jgi:FAD/FMN-containing dehydrogenase
MLTRRGFLKNGTLAAATALAARPALTDDDRSGVDVNDMQSMINATRVRAVEKPQSVDDVQRIIHASKRSQSTVSVCGGRHAMGGQQFATNSVLLDTTELIRVREFDRVNGMIDVGAGIQWPELVSYLEREQAGQPEIWTIREKQSGVDNVCLGGSLASNIHGRGLKFPPLVCDVESFVLVDANGEARTCSRKENTELFSLAIGGYGLFGVIASVRLKLARRFKVERVVEIIPVCELLERVQQRIDDGFLFGDCQYATSLDSRAEEHPGVFACYRPVTTKRPVPDQRIELPSDDWAALYRLARTDKKKAFETYSRYYLSTDRQLYWSDRHQLSGNFQSYRKGWDTRAGTDMITEVYVAPQNFLPFMSQSRQDCIDHAVDMTYGTIRFIEPDQETFLRWATERFVCIVCNLHVTHTEAGHAKAASDFRRILDRVIEFGGRYYLTYHRWATRRHVEAAYPQFVEFLKLKLKYDSDERFQSNWYRHYREMFRDAV